MEAFHQLVLSAQRQTPVNPETYTKSTSFSISGAHVIMLRKEFSQEPAKVLPLVEEQELSDLLIRVGHISQFGAVRLGRQFHRSPSSTLKHILVSDIGFFQHKLLIHINNLVKHCMFCNLVRPISVQAPPGTRVAGTLNSDLPYSHVSCDNIQLSFCIPFFQIFGTCLHVPPYRTREYRTDQLLHLHQHQVSSQTY